MKIYNRHYTNGKLFFGGCTEDCYSELANAIIIQAADDYLKARCNKKLKIPPKKNEASHEYRMQECKRFFRSEWFGSLTQINPETLIRSLNELCECCDYDFNKILKLRAGA